MALAPADASAQLLDAGRASTRSWGEFETVLELGWPRVGIGLRWGTWRGGHHMVGVDAQTRSGTLFTSFTASQPLQRRGSVTATGFVASGLLLRPAGRGLDFELGPRVVPGISACVGIAARRRSCLEFGAEVPLQAWVRRGFRPSMGIRGSLGWSVHLTPRTSLGLRGRGGLVLVLDEPPSVAWSAALVLRAQLGARVSERQSDEVPSETAAASSHSAPLSSGTKAR